MKKFITFILCLLIICGTMNITAMAVIKSDATSPWKWPTKSTKVGQHYKAGIHKGIDISPFKQGVSGDKVYASMDGKVVYSGWLNGYGNVVYINHSYNGTFYQTRYAHFKSSPPVKVGKQIKAGDLVGYEGTTGRSTGPHLHFEIRKSASGSPCDLSNAGSNPMDPLLMLNKP